MATRGMSTSKVAPPRAPAPPNTPRRRSTGGEGATPPVMARSGEEEAGSGPNGRRRIYHVTIWRSGDGRHEKKAERGEEAS